MKRRVSGRLLICFLFNCLVVIPLNIIAQRMTAPLPAPFLLSGNFAELRATHFHGGIDIRTGGVEGLPVVCVKDGQAVRISVSPTGYGQALYVRHADGTTTVYGHLQRFVPEIARIVRDLQYQKESFKVDEEITAYGLFFRQGEVIAYSGNSGSSGGPHLHFEVRNTQSEHIINPLRYFNIKDTRPPIVRMICLYSVAENGYVELIRQCPVKPAGNGRYDAGQITLPAGRIGVGVFATDYMNDSQNKLGVYDLALTADGKPLFRLTMDSCSFSQNCFINEIKDFERYKKNETVYRCFGHYQHQFMGITNQNEGCITLGQDSLVKVNISLSDINQNRSVVVVSLKGGMAKKTGVNGDDLLRYDQAHTLDLPGIRVELASGSLFSSVKKVLKVTKDSVSDRNVFVLSEKEIPLFRKAHLFMEGNFDRRTVICEVGTTGRRYPLETQWTEKGLSADISCLSRYTVAEDHESPTIVYSGKFPDRTLRFKIRDSFSGIATWRGEVNGNWCLFSYDPRVDLLQCSLAEPVFEWGKTNEVKVVVEDKAGNSRELKVNVGGQSRR